MLRFATAGVVLLSLFAAANLYRVSYQTRIVAHELRDTERELSELARSVETLRAEREYLARPAAIERAARAIGMRPARGDQFARQATASTPAVRP